MHRRSRPRSRCPAQCPRGRNPRSAGSAAGAGRTWRRGSSLTGIDEIFAIEREINGTTTDRRLAIRQDRLKPLVFELKTWMEAERSRLSHHAAAAKAIDYMLKRRPAFTRFLDNG